MISSLQTEDEGWLGIVSRHFPDPQTLFLHMPITRCSPQTAFWPAMVNHLYPDSSRTLSRQHQSFRRSWLRKSESWTKVKSLFPEVHQRDLHICIHQESNCANGRCHPRPKKVQKAKISTDPQDIVPDAAV
jgi:hypothetical protein